MNYKRFKKTLVPFWGKCLSFLVGSTFILSSCGPEPPPEIIPPVIGPGDTTIIEVSELPDLIIPPDNPLTVAGVDLGRHLFYDKMLSGDQTQACANCHIQSSAFTDNLAVSEGIRGEFGDRSSMPIFNLMWADSLFWDSRAGDLRELATMPIENPIEMDAKIEDVLVRLNNSIVYQDKFKTAFNADVITKEHLSKALEQFLLSITSDNSKFDKFNRGEVQLTAQELRGFESLKVKGCFNCHSGPILHDNISHNTALDLNPKDRGLQGFTDNPMDKFKFKTPSLRNVMVSQPYMHDGRFETIEEVIEFYEEVGKTITNHNNSNAPKELMLIAPRNRLTQQEMEDVKAFLHTLTDQTYLTNPKYSDPF